MATRKLQTEMDRVFKKVQEGIELFEELYDKLYAATKESQKEKYEVELKKEIKKLQRLRDQIKTWLTMSEIKDKRALLDNRKLIEQQMEKFKACEREMKTKQYSKEGLQAKEKLDPAEVAKMEASHWITATVDKLNTQVDALEAESEQIKVAKTRKMSRADSERLKAIAHNVERHKFHMQKLETMLRMLENDALSTEDIESVKDSVEYYVDSNQEPDFLEDEEIYDHLDLVEEDPLAYQDDLDHLDPHHEEPEPKRKASKDAEAESVVSPVKASGKSNAPSKPGSSSKAVPKSTPAPKPAPVVAPAPPPATPKPPAPPTQKYAAAVAAGIDNRPPMSAVVAAGIAKDPPKSADMSPRISAAKDERKVEQAPAVPQEQPQLPASAGKIETAVKPVASYQASSNNVKPLLSSAAKDKFPSVFSDLISSFNAAKSKCYGNGDEILRNQHLLQILDGSFRTCPDVVDSERPRQYVPKNPYATPAFYPNAPLLSFDTPAVFEKFDIDTLFFIFYYQQDTRQQYLAARELKRQSWRFHKKYLTWFQRHEEPKSITDEYEQGTYIYFDYEGAWCQRKKTEFTFEYRFLEDE